MIFIKWKKKKMGRKNMTDVVVGLFVYDLLKTVFFIVIPFVFFIVFSMDEGDE